MTKAAITTIGAALLAAAALALSGCSYPGDDEDRAAFHAEAQDPVPSAPATEPTEPETPAEETGDESTEEGGQVNEQPLGGLEAAAGPVQPVRDLGVETLVALEDLGRGLLGVHLQLRKHLLQVLLLHHGEELGLGLGLLGGIWEPPLKQALAKLQDRSNE